MNFECFIKFFATSKYADGYYAEDLNFIASCLFRESREEGSWTAILELLEDLTEPKKREGICIAIIESAVEEPVDYGWFDVLPKILANKNLYWVVERGYKYFTKSLYEHIVICNHMIGVEKSSI